MPIQSWEQVDRRERVIDELLTTARAHRDFRSPWSRTPAVWDEYHHVSDLLRDLCVRFERSLRDEVGRAVAGATGDPRDGVARAFDVTARRHPDLRRIIEANAHHRAVAPLLAAEQHMLAAAAGVPDADLVLPSGLDHANTFT